MFCITVYTILLILPLTICFKHLYNEIDQLKGLANYLLWFFQHQRSFVLLLGEALQVV